MAIKGFGRVNQQVEELYLFLPTCNSSLLKERFIISFYTDDLGGSCVIYVLFLTPEMTIIWRLDGSNRSKETVLEAKVHGNTKSS